MNPVPRIPAGLAAPETDLEGCLSVPGQHAELTRAGLAIVTGLDVRGRLVTVTGTGVLARCLQHETDHLDGTVYVDRLPAAERTAILAAAGLGRASPRPDPPGGSARSRAVSAPASAEELTPTRGAHN